MSLNLPSYFFKMVFLVVENRFNFLSRANWKEASAKSRIDSSVLYMDKATPGPLKSNTGNQNVGGSVLIPECVTANDDWLFPLWDDSRDRVDDDWFSKHGPTKNVSDGTVWRFPHLLQFELFHSGFIWSDGGTFDGNTVFQSGLC
ncbi:hypothetical protein WICPIJ_000971 [Wickerhamomyces pijperi]|uniref:Uncharacterized protein n=1 Tax=Wickerhamomyces pijperi TaxID=599730 RepID=A0A9P8QCN7_WICPI|nr:hypothetical protein WICPIJ_000971 [Wickerhamomyces pijperi]